MAEAPMPATRDGRHEWWISLALIVAVVLFRASIFVFWERSHFDSDQAITGLMAKHLAEGRAFPVFWYGQSHMLAVESWLAAPLFLAFGTSVAALKLPLLAMNVAIALLLLRGFVREVGCARSSQSFRRCSSRCPQPAQPHAWLKRMAATWSPFSMGF